MHKTRDGLEEFSAIPSTPKAPSTQETASHHLAALEAILEADYLRSPNLSTAMADLAGRAQDALRAKEAIVALWDESLGHWSGLGRWGTHLDKVAISQRASASILEEVRISKAPVLVTEEEDLDDLNFSSKSLHLNQVDSIIAVPLWWWDLQGGTKARTLRGVLYVHRTLGDDAFTQSDVRLLSNIAHLAQPILGLLSHLEALATNLSAKEAEVRGLKDALEGQGGANPLETTDPTYSRDVIQRLRRLSTAPKVNILLTGPSGSGKTYLARAFHGLSLRKDAPFIVLDCAQVTSAETLGAELFGYAPASGYANAPPEGRLGKARLANGGILFIDEIACLDITLQHRLLRLIDQGAFSPLGSSEEIAVDLQIIAATNANLNAEVDAGRFREDLYWRLSEVTFTLPALDQRPGDIPHLAQVFLAQASRRYGRRDVQTFSPAAIHSLKSAAWSQAGNLRGLAHCIGGAILMTKRGQHVIHQQDLSLPPAREQTTPTPAAISQQGRSDAIDPEETGTHQALMERIYAHSGVLSNMAKDDAVAQLLGYETSPIPTSSLRLRLRKMGLMDTVEAARQSGKAVLSLSDAIKAVKEAGSGAGAARSLGVSRSQLVWKLRAAGMTIAEALDA